MMVGPLWKTYGGFVLKGRRFRSIFNRITPFPIVALHPYGWMPYVQGYFRYYYHYYWPGVSFPFFRWGPYRFFNYLPATVYYGSFVSYYDYSYAVTAGTEALDEYEALEETAEE